MTEHLPECLALLNDSTWDGDCICGALRACEQRVLNDYRKQHDGISEGYFQQIRNDALDAAREAVEEMDLHGCHPYRFPDCNCLGPQVIAAIDALKEGS